MIAQAPRPQPASDADELAARTHAAALGVEARSPLAQIELAASQIYREALTPNARAQSEQIFEAVAQIDALVDRMLRVLVPPKRSATREQALAPILAALRQRFAPALMACGVEWIFAEDRASGATNQPQQVRKLCTELLRLALALSGKGGSFEFDLAEGGGGVEARLVCLRREACSETQAVAARAAVAQARAVILEDGGVLVGQADAQGSALHLVIPNPRDGQLPISTEQEESCRES